MKYIVTVDFEVNAYNPIAAEDRVTSQFTDMKYDWDVMEISYDVKEVKEAE